MSNKKRIAKKIQNLNNRSCSVGRLRKTVKVLNLLAGHSDHVADAFKYFSDALSIMSTNFINGVNTARGRDTNIYESYQYGVDVGSWFVINRNVPKEYIKHYDGLTSVGFTESEAFELLKETFKF